MRTSYKTLTSEEYRVLCKIANKTNMDCWFYIKQDNKGTDYIYDLEERKRLCLKTGINQLVEGLDCAENYNNCNLTDDEDKTFKKLLNKLKIEFNI